MTQNDTCACGCEHSHDDTHSETCGCGCGCEHTKEDKKPVSIQDVSENQKAFLHQLSHTHCLPVACFTLKDSREKDFVSTALAPVFIRSAADSMETVKEAGAFLKHLEEMDLITLDYDIPLNSYAYDEYKNSAIYEYFCETVAQGATKPNFLGNEPCLELGSMALTENGEKIVSEICNHE